MNQSQGLKSVNNYISLRGKFQKYLKQNDRAILKALHVEVTQARRDALLRNEKNEFSELLEDIESEIERLVELEKNSEPVKSELVRVFHVMPSDSVVVSVIDDDCRNLLEECEREIIAQTLQRFKGNRTQTSKYLGISIRTLRNRLNEWRGRGMIIEYAIQ